MALGTVCTRNGPGGGRLQLSHQAATSRINRKPNSFPRILFIDVSEGVDK